MTAPTPTQLANLYYESASRGYERRQITNGDHTRALRSVHEAGRRVGLERAIEVIEDARLRVGPYETRAGMGHAINAIRRELDGGAR